VKQQTVAGASSWSTLRTLLRIGGVPARSLLCSTALGTAVALSTVALMACSGALIDKASLRPPLYTLTVLMAAVQIFALTRGPLRYYERLVSHDAALGVLGRLRLWLYDELAPRSPAGLGHWRNGDLLVRATGDIETLQDLYQRGISPMLVAGSTWAFSLILLGVFLPVAGVIMAGGLGLALVLTSFLAWARHRRLGTRETALRGNLAADVVELFQGAPDLVAYGLDEAYLERALDCDQSLTEVSRRRAWTAGTVNVTSTLILGATVVGLLAVAISAAHAQRIPVFMLAIFPLVALGAFEVVIPAADAFSNLSEHLGAAARLLEVATLPLPVVDPEDARRSTLDGSIECTDVQLRYAPDQPLVLNGLSLTIAAGSRVAIIGPSGAGKSSIVNLLLRFWEAEAGQVTIGGIPIEALTQETVRATIGWLPQDGHLFNSSIRSNIVLGRPGALEADVIDVVNRAQLGPWVDSLPQGLDTRVGENGAQVSGGQRQRIALARALLANPQILILDEATSSLDLPTARRLLRDVTAATAGKTLLYITHRLDELVGFDAVYRIEGGVAVDVTGEDLIGAKRFQSPELVTSD